MLASVFLSSSHGISSGMEGIKESVGEEKVAKFL